MEIFWLPHLHWVLFIGADTKGLRWLSSSLNFLNFVFYIQDFCFFTIFSPKILVFFFTIWPSFTPLCPLKWWNRLLISSNFLNYINKNDEFISQMLIFESVTYSIYIYIYIYIILPQTEEKKPSVHNFLGCESLPSLFVKIKMIL